MQLLAIAGPIHTGKDTVADFLVDRYGFTKMAWADPLYTEVEKAFDFPTIVMKQRDVKEKPHALLTADLCKDSAFADLMRAAEKEITGGSNDELGWMEFSPREVLQLWGTEYRRKQDPSYWVKQTVQRIEDWKVWSRHKMADAIRDDDQDYVEPGGIAVVGTRFKDEAQAIYALGGRLLHIERPGFEIVTTHVSDKPLPIRTGDLLLINGGDLPTLGTGVSILLGGQSIVNTGNDYE